MLISDQAACSSEAADGQLFPDGEVCVDFVMLNWERNREVRRRVSGISAPRSSGRGAGSYAAWNSLA